MPYPIQNSKKSNNGTILVLEKQPYTLVLMTLVLFETGCRFLCFLDKLHKTDNLCVILLNLFVFIPRTVLQQSHKNEKIVALLTFLLELEISGVGLQIIHQNSKKQWLCEIAIVELLSENVFETILATFCCYDYGVYVSEAVQNIATVTDQKDCYKCSLCVIVC